jgi:hypothetical protein
MKAAINPLKMECSKLLDTPKHVGKGKRNTVPVFN